MGSHQSLNVAPDPARSANLGDPRDAQRITVNLAGEAGGELRTPAKRCRVSESSIVELALRELFARVNGPTWSAFPMAQWRGPTTQAVNAHYHDRGRFVRMSVQARAEMASYTAPRIFGPLAQLVRAHA